MGRERREANKGDGGAAFEKRSREKVEEILRDQQGDMSAYTGNLDISRLVDCRKISDLPVESIMSAKVAVLSFDDNLLTVQGIFSSVKFRHLPVVDDAGGIIGIVSDRDFLRVVSPFFGTINEQNRDKEIMARKVGTIMTRKPICANRKTSIIQAVCLMNERKISCLPIVEEPEKTLLGIITWKDVVRAFCPSGFSRTSDSSRLRAGVKLNPQTSESARMRARAEENTRMRPREESTRMRPRPVGEEAKAVSQRLAARVLASDKKEEKRPSAESTRSLPRHIDLDDEE